MRREGLQSAVCVKCREELVEDDLCNVLCLRTHSYGLGSNVHRENFRRPDPGCRSPGRLVEENEEKEHKHD